MLRKCTLCNVEKEDSNEFFIRDYSRKDGISARCRKCTRDHQKRRKKERINNEPSYRMLHNLRCRFYTLLKNSVKSDCTINLLGCSIDFLKIHLENQFVDGMSWNNYGEWHIDHIRPCSSYDLVDSKQQRECFHYTNLQPLWAIDNIKKGSKYNKSG